MKNKGAIAILGGMGPEASAKMLEVMVSMATREFGAKDCKEFPEIILDSIPVPDFISNRQNVGLASKILKDRVTRLDNFEISCFAIACNTAHIMLPSLKAVSTRPFISMIDAVTIQVAREGFQTVGIMGTPSTIKSRLYQDALQKFGIETVLPSNKQVADMELVIRRVISNENTKSDSVKLAKTANSLIGKGAEAIILGCTELPLAFPKDFPWRVFDSIEILARTLLTKSLKGGDLNA